jgi:hypothetical protein
LKQEKKGAKKEIRKDMAFLAAVKVSSFFVNNYLLLLFPNCIGLY